VELDGGGARGWCNAVVRMWRGWQRPSLVIEEISGGGRSFTGAMMNSNTQYETVMNSMEQCLNVCF
jgi:hypothetical protein